MNLPQTLEQAIVFHQAQRTAEAERLYKIVLNFDPDNCAALHMLGVLRFQQGKPDDALILISRAVENGISSPEILNNHGLVLLTLGRLDESLHSLDLALRNAPDFAQARYNRANALRLLGRFEEALADYDRAMEIQPGYIEAILNRGVTLRSLHRYLPALECFDRVLSVAPSNAEALNNRGTVLQDMGRAAEALASYSAAIAIRSDYADALHNRAVARWEHRKDYEGAIEDLENVIRVSPHFPFARGMLLHLRMHIADWRDLETEISRINAGVVAGEPVVPPFVYQAISQSPANLQTCSRTYAQALYPARPVPSRAMFPPHRRTRIGYLAGEFRAHATSFLSAGLFEAHDRDAFEVYAFDNGQDDGSPIRKRLELAFDHLIKVWNLSDGEAAARIANLEIDILVNLNGYFGRQRMGIFSRRPAPIQVSYLGFPATLGSECMDYILADRQVIPAGETEFYTERVAYLPDSYQINDLHRQPAAPIPSRRQCGLPESSFVFCWFNQAYKLLPAMFASWMKILREVENSVLWILGDNPAFTANLSREAVRRGVAAGRLVFAPMLPLDEHLARLKLGDLCLDSLPYNGHTSASDALWAGLPLLTCRGQSFAGRVAASLLYALGLPELVTDDLNAFENRAIALGRDASALAGVRAKLKRNRLTQPLFDTKRTCRHIEAAYKHMMQIHRSGQSPHEFTVEATI